MRYPGGKGAAYQKLINLMPPHEVYIETHLGGGAVMRNKRPARSNIGIEIDTGVVGMWTNMQPIDFELVHDNAITYLKNYHFTGKELVYCDPPYLRETRKKYGRLYKYDYSYAQHIELLEVLKTLPCMVMISGYESTLYKKALQRWQTHCYQAVCHHGVATEWLWMNYSVSVELHDYRYLGDNFRERERIKRKTQRWVSKLESMPILERQALLSAMDVVREQ
jgi:site-specific DNA-adenine methylase